MLRANRRIELLERYRVPYELDEGAPAPLVELVRDKGGGPRLISVHSSSQGVERLVLDGTTIFVALADEADVAEVRDSSGLTWSEEIPIVDRRGTSRAAVLAAPDGSVLLPFDLDAPLNALLEGTYDNGLSDVLKVVSRGYYRLRPMLPRQVQLALRRRFRRVQERSTFPGWPVETAFHRLEALMLGLVERVAGEPLPWLAPWPAPYGWALVLTHDVERAPGYANVRSVQDVEAKLGLRSAWYFVPERDYVVEPSLLDDLRAGGCEIGLHGLRHDGRDLSPAAFPTRLEAMQRYARQWEVQGFRSPSTFREPALVQQLGLEHDSSWPDVARYEPQPGGCCSWLPYFIGSTLVELPITLAQDHTLFELRGEQSEEAWLAKTEFLRRHEGMALLLTHPDYLDRPERIETYRRYLAAQAHDTTVWHALPREVSSWWRLRAESRLVREDGRWVVQGAGKDRAQLRLGAPAAPPPSADLTD